MARPPRSVGRKAAVVLLAGLTAALQLHVQALRCWHSVCDDGTCMSLASEVRTLNHDARQPPSPSPVAGCRY